MVSGEAIKPAHADDRPVDAPGKILVTPAMGASPVLTPRRSPLQPAPVRPVAPAKRSGAWLVVLVYLLSASALGYEIWQRFLR